MWLVNPSVGVVNMSFYKLGYYLIVILGVFVTESLLAGAGIKNPYWYSAPYVISRPVIIILSMFGAGVIFTWCYRNICRKQ